MAVERATEMVTVEQLGDAIQRCAAAHPEYTSQKLLHPDAERLCEALAGMNYRKLNAVGRNVFQGTSGSADEVD